MPPIVTLSTTTLLLAFGLLIQILSCSSQNLDPNVDDKEYLDMIQKRLRQESLEAHAVLINQTKLLQQLTRKFIETKIRENLFKAVRERVEVELEEMAQNGTSASPHSLSSTQSSRQSRQDEDDDDDSTPPTTPRPRQGLLPQLANVVTTLFGSDVNVTGYLKDATAFLPTDLSNRILTAASLIDPNRFTSTTPQPQSQLIINGQVVPQGALLNGTTFVYSQAGLPQVVQSSNFVQQPGTVLQSLNPNTNNNINPNNNQVPQQTAPQSQPAYVVPQSSNVNTGIEQRKQENLNNNGDVQSISRPGTPQQPNHIVGIGGGPVASGVSAQLQQPPVVYPSPTPNFKVNDIFIPSVRRSTTLAPSSNEDEDEENNSSEKTVSANTKNPQDEEDSAEDDLAVANPQDDEFIPRDDDPSFQSDDKPTASYLDEYPIVKYGIRIFQVLTAKATVPTTTEYVNTTTVEKTIESIEEEEASKGVTPANAVTYKQVVQTGVYLFEGAREAYQFLQNINGYLDRIGNRLDNAGYGPEDVGVDLK